MKYSLLLMIAIVSGLTFGKEEKVPTLCEDPLIHSADRLPNETARVYRGDYYWELMGLPDRVAIVRGPYKIPYKYMAPTHLNTSIMTILSGPSKGDTWKFEGQRKWQWDPSGANVVGNRAGVTWNDIPRGGFSCVMNDGDYDKKGSTRMIAIQNLKVYYWKTDRPIFDPVGDTYNGHHRGQFNELFPNDVTACMAIKSSDEHKYYVYLFSRKRYCYRPIIGVDGCIEWRDNTELFGCNTKGSGDENASPDQTTTNVNAERGVDNQSDNTSKPVEDTKGSGVGVGPTFHNTLLILVLYYFYI